MYVIALNIAQSHIRVLADQCARTQLNNIPLILEGSPQSQKKTKVSWFKERISSARLHPK